MRLAKATLTLSVLAALAACTDEAKKFEGYWLASSVGVALAVNEGATEVRACMRGMNSLGMKPEVIG